MSTGSSQSIQQSEYVHDDVYTQQQYST